MGIKIDKHHLKPEHSFFPKSRLKWFLSKKATVIIICILLMTVGFFVYYQTTLGKTSKQITYSAPEIRKEIKKNDEKKAMFDLQLVDQITETDVFQAEIKESINPSDNILFGGLILPKVGIKLPIYNGFGGRHQMLGACTPKPNQVPGERNYALVGHNFTNPNLLFSPLRKLPNDSTDLVYLVDSENVYEYQITQILLANKSEYHWIEDSDVKDKPLLTLVTCYGGDGTPTRKIVRAEYKKKYPIEKSPISLN